MVLGTSESIGSMLDRVLAPTQLREKQEMHRECSQLQVTENPARSNFLKSREIFLHNKKSVGKIF